MAEHQVTIRWQRTTPDFDYNTFDRTHSWYFAGGQTLQGSSAPAYYGNPALVSPEEALVATLSSCFMLTFLSIAARRRFVVESYEDQAEGELGKNDQGRIMISRITLRPRVVFSADRLPDAEILANLYRRAEENCFVSNSLRSEVVVEPR